MKAVLVQFLYEANTFSPRTLEIDGFKTAGTWRVGETSVREWARGAASQTSGSLKILEAAGWQVAPVFAAVCGSPAGRLSRACFEEIRTTIREQVRAALPADAVIMNLHGAASAVGEDDVEGNLLEMVRNELNFRGRLVLSLDLHANMTRKMAAHADAITAYHTMPHIDMAETGERAARLAMSNEKTVRAVARMKALVPPSDQNHFAGRFRTMLELARAAEKTPGIHDVAVLPVQPWLDIDELGSCIAVTGTGAAPARVARELAETWYAQRAAWETPLVPWDSIIAKLKTAPAGANKPWILVDTADATTGGSSGRSAEAVRQLLPHAKTLPGLALLWAVDPAFVETARVGARGTFTLGVPAVTIDGEVVAKAEGTFVTSGKLCPGMQFSMCGAAVVAHGNLRVVVSREPIMAVDHAFYESVGLQPRQALCVQTKCIMSWMAAFEAPREQGMLFDGPGACSLNFRALKFSATNRGLYPMTGQPADPIEVWTSE